MSACSAAVTCFDSDAAAVVLAAFVVTVVEAAAFAQCVVLIQDVMAVVDITLRAFEWLFHIGLEFGFSGKSTTNSWNTQIRCG